MGTEEKKLADAETVRLSLKGTVESSKGETKTSGTILLATGNKARIDFTYDTDGKTQKIQMVSDGTKTKGDGIDLDTPKKTNALLAGIKGRTD